MRITQLQSTQVAVPIREPLTWAAGIRESASGLIIQLHTDEGLSGVGEAPGPTLPAIQTIVEREFSQFLIGQDPLRIDWLLHRLDSYSANWSELAAYAIAGIEMALLDLKGKVLGVPVAQLLGGFGRESVPVVGYLFIDEPEANAQRAADFVAAGHTELKLKVGRDLGRDRDTVAAIRDRVGWNIKLRLDANMAWSVPTAIKSIRAFEPYDIQYVEQPVAHFDIAGLAQVRRAVSVPIAADESCTTLRSVIDLVKADACDVFVVYPSEAGGVTRAMQIGALATAAGKTCVLGSWAELGVATMANAHLAAASMAFSLASDTHYPLQLADVLADPVTISDGQIELLTDTSGLGVQLDESRLGALASSDLRQSPFFDDVAGESPRISQLN